MPTDSTSYCRVCGAVENDAAINGDFLPWICPACAALEKKIASEVIQRINSMPYEKMLALNRFTPTGEGFFAHRETGEYFAMVMARKRAEVGPAAHTGTSKAIGWGGHDEHV